MTDPNNSTSGHSVDSEASKPGKSRESEAASETWLVRTRQNRILGPMSRAEVCQLIWERRIGIEDEICRSNSYWFYLHEHQELASHLGIHLPRQLGDEDDEVTETETEILEVTDDVSTRDQSRDSLGLGGQGPAEGSSRQQGDQELSEAEKLFRQSLSTGLDRPSFRRTLLTALLVIFVVLLFLTFRSLR